MHLRIVHGIFSSIILVCLGMLYGCNSAPVPSEVAIAETLEHELWRAGAVTYAPKDYSAYKSALRSGKDHLIKEQNRFAWFRDYESVQKEFGDILSKGDDILDNIEEQKRNKLTSVAQRITYFQSKIETFKKLSSFVNEGRLSRRHLISAELLLNEAQLLTERGKYPEAEKKLRIIPVYIVSAQGAISPVLNRYADKGQIAKWRKWVNETINASRAKGTYSIFVSKIDRKLVLYKNGNPYKTYTVGLGKNGFHDKLHAGDLATPEGKYRVIKKLPRSKYHMALLINYPNDEDIRQFAAAKRKGLIPSKAGIGGLIEIHGGGKEGMTYGCIGMENKHITELFNLVDVGTPVTIVGAIDDDNIISSTIKNL